ncbi:PhzF family phenazine biosynthesis protein [Poritiphilus flavus]|uniref:PhzF family phenazine biosynthesis isomerase n=1 Tax=Poritiphilus flavus TaxID=2697053 RepID=A0A6L9E7V1_9FLAO|nr:PhzF family phenazine biosynthesis protein [Poritiphilus flavus]NAS10865.1 PhzF family phenazine biosynthesis isomerase [Poritiphilus flavus]
MKQTIYQIDAFTDKPFSGNPAAVCILEDWLDDSLMQQIAMENNLAETAFVVKNEDRYEVRWFTPEVEVDLCGHATLASAYVLFNYYQPDGDTLRFFSARSGELVVKRDADGTMTMDFPADTLTKVASMTLLNEALGKEPLETFKGKTDFLLIYDDQEGIEAMRPNFLKLSQLDARGVIVSAAGNSVDFVSRFFAPQSGINEDPVTGSAHTSLTPYWSEVLGKTKMTARQLSARGGNLQCEYLGERVKIAGKAVPYLIGEIEV